jgi:hypothetical protein
MVELPWRRTGDPVREGDGAAVPPTRQELSLWDKAGLLDPAPAPDTTNSPDRGDDPGHRTSDDPVADGSATTDRELALLEAGRQAPEKAVAADEANRPDHELPRDIGEGRLRYGIHEQKSLEILGRERPLVSRVARVVGDCMGRISSDAWDDASPKVRIREIIKIGKEVQRAMHLPQVRIFPVELDLCGMHDMDDRGHRIRVDRRMDILSVLATLVHEMRHVYQVEVMQGRSGYHPDAATWAENDHEYKECDEEDIDSYYTQPLEADTFGFERAVGKILGLDWPEI